MAVCKRTVLQAPPFKYLLLFAIFRVHYVCAVCSLFQCCMSLCCLFGELSLIVVKKIWASVLRLTLQRLKKNKH